MAKITPCTLSDFFAKHVKEKSTTLSLKDDTAKVKIKADGAPKSFTSTDVVSFLEAAGEVRVSQKVELDTGTVSSSGVVSGSVASQAVGHIVLKGVPVQ